MIAQAAQKLDELYPGWAALLDEDFDITDPDHCIGHALDVAWEELADQCGVRRAAFASGQEEWLDEIHRRVG
jgi:hypothetical protein